MISTLIPIFFGVIVGAGLVWLVIKLVKPKSDSPNNLHDIETQLSESNTKLRIITDRAEHLNVETHRLQGELSKIAIQKEEISSLLSAERIRTDEGTKRLAELKAEIEAKRSDIEKYSTDLQHCREKAIDLDKENKYLKEQILKQKQDLEEIGKQFTNEFKLLADHILEDKSKRFTEMNMVNIERLLKPLGENITQFQKKVEEVYDRESKERFSLGKEVGKLVELNHKISEEAQNLTNALKGQVKQQGNWGEMILESILEKSGLVKGREYFVQESVKNEEGRRFQPDVIINYPDNRKVVIDSKVSLVGYERYCSSNDVTAQEKALAEHIRSVRTHIDMLGSKKYQDMVGGLDFVTMFLPIEPAYMVAMQADPEIWNYAYNRGVLLLSPTNLIAALRLIHNLWQREYQNRHALEIAERGGQLYDKFVLFVENMQSIGDNLLRTQKSYESALGQLSEGKGNLVNQAQKLKELGAKAKKSLPESLIDSTDDQSEKEFQL